METNTTGLKNLKRPKIISIPSSVTRDGNLPSINGHQSSLFKRLSQVDLLPPNSHDIVKTWLFIEPESNKRVQFATDDNNRNEKPRTNSDLIESLPDIDQHIPSKSFDSENKDELKLSPVHNNHFVSTTEAKFYRSASINKTLSIASTTSSVSSRLRQPRFVPPPSSPAYQYQASSDRSSIAFTNTSSVKEQTLYLSALEYDSSLSESDRKKFDEILRLIPDEYEQLLPTLLKLGIVTWPKKLFDNNEELTFNEKKQRDRLITIIDKDQEDSQRQRYLQRLYGNVSSVDDVLHKQHLIRANLSFEGQLSLLEAYRDAIEIELVKKIPNWKSIPMRILRPSLLDETGSIGRTSILGTTLHAKQKFLQRTSLRKPKMNSNVYQLTYEETFSLGLPDKIDDQWQRKSLVKIIEQGMNILDQIRKLSLNQDEDSDFNGHQIVRTFKRWLFLWSTLFIENKCLF
ncbi:unnamed protein product [Adineta steineri]|uniref:Uncharacterized protein n=1 Tax=Adineta steineri TaxID=433720 RepID=A0A815IFB8_9BILA|nr:unnamed protein product [Adineta steineri]CAF3782954.1 unnamed protein product [Adineta steineri]